MESTERLEQHGQPLEEVDPTSSVAHSTVTFVHLSKAGLWDAGAETAWAKRQVSGS